MSGGGERHTRQGCARGQGHGTLDRDDPELGNGRIWAATSHTGMKNQGHVPQRATRAIGPSDTIAAGGCWCGLPDGHWWPGCDEGAPHPRGDDMVQAFKRRQP